MKFRTSAFSAVFLWSAMLTAPAAEPFTRAGWVADLAQIKAALTAGYPNLEWAAERGMDLAAVERRALERIERAADEAAARRALERFIGAFGDGHLRIDWPAPASAPASPAPAASTPGSAPPLCADLGYAARPDTRAIASNLPGYRSLRVMGANVAAGRLESQGRQVGILRIAEFMPDTSLCERAARELEAGVRGDCGEQCRRDVEQRTEALFVESLQAAIRDIVAGAPDLLLVDLAGNGGGNDSAIAAARMLTAAPLGSPRMTFVRSSARATDLRGDAADLRREAQRGDGADRKFLAPLITRLEAASAEAASSCDLSPLWLGRKAGCSNLLGPGFFAGGLVDQELPTDRRDRPWAERVSATARYTFEPGLWTGPLVILVDGHSASAAELFTAMLQDAGRARVVGSPTLGAGCGWTLPRAPVELAHSRGQLFMPDCARLRADGSNELDGIQPALLIGFREYDSAAQRARRFTAALPGILAGTP